jgi:hypothetical protein
MLSLRLFLLISLTASIAFAQQRGWTPAEPVPDSCPIVKRPIVPYVPPPPFDKKKVDDYGFWIGNDRLFMLLSDTMVSQWTARAPGHEHDEYPRTAKVFYYSAGYNSRLDASPQLTVTARRLNGPAPTLLIDHATNALGEDGTGAMVTALYIPAPGCWEITGHYKNESLSFVVWVTPEKVTSSNAARVSVGQN